MHLLTTLLTLLLTLTPTLAMPQGATKTGLSAGTPVRDVQDATCTTGASADPSIVNYTLVQPDFAANGAYVAYGVDKEWSAEHYVSGPHYIGVTHDTGSYGAFKCQYTCNAADTCASFFVWYEQMGTNEEHIECLLFDAVIAPDNFVILNNNTIIASGGYDRICGTSNILRD